MNFSRKLLALFLSVAVGLIGFQIPVQTSENLKTLSFNGYPLTQVLNRESPLFIASFLQNDIGNIRGVAINANGEPLRDQTIRLLSFVQIGPRLRSEIINTAKTTILGQFEFSGVPEGSYFVDMQIGGDIILSETFSLIQGAMLKRGITLTHEGKTNLLKKIALIGTLAGVGVFLGYSLASGQTIATFLDERPGTLTPNP